MLLSGDPRRPYPTDLEMRSGMLGHMANLPTNGVNGHLPGDALAAGRLPGESIRMVCLTCEQVKFVAEDLNASFFSSSSHCVVGRLFLRICVKSESSVGSWQLRLSSA